MTNFENLWRKNFGNTPPLGHRLREKFSSRWIRFHALPISKRYADNDAEYSVIISRANTLMNEIFDSDEALYIVSSRADKIPSVTNYDIFPYTKNSRRLSYAFSWMDPESEPADRFTWSTHSKKLAWNEGQFNDVFLKIADEEDYGILFANSDLSSLVAPYDGGYDLILENTKVAQTLRKKYMSWTSPRSDGL